MNKSQTGKYFKYAIGEIVLVVIGILIALQINNWNENNIEKKHKKAILSNIHNEFKQNKKVLLRDLETNNNAFNSGLKLMELMGKPQHEIKIYNTDSLLYTIVDFNSFNPSENAISDLLQSGRLQLLTNEKLKDHLYDWSRIMTLAKENYQGYDSKVENYLIPYLTKYYSIKDIDKYGFLKWKKSSTLKVDKLKVFQEIEFENLIDDALYRLKGYNTALLNAQLIIDNILNETKK